MSLAGRLEQVDLAALLQTLAVNRSTGRLTLTRRESHGVLVFREGRIIYAAARSARETFGSILLLRGLITEADLGVALERQNAAAEPVRLGRVLVEMGKVDERALRDVMKEQTREVLQDLLSWKTGFFKFEPLEISPEGEVEVDVKDFLVPEGFTAQEVLTLPEPIKAVLDGDMPAPGILTPPRGTPQISLGVIVNEAPSPPFTAEITLRLMRYAAQILNRGALFLVRPDEVRGMGQFGINLPGRFAAEVVRDTAIPLSEPSVFRDVVEGRETYRGPLPATPWNRHLAERLGGAKPTEVVVLPMVVGGTVRLVFYGDNLPEQRDVGPLDALEYAVAEAALAMERALVESREKSLEGRRPPPE
jgi:uncharacterized protein DUF4388